MNLFILRVLAVMAENLTFKHAQTLPSPAADLTHLLACPATRHDVRRYHAQGHPLLKIAARRQIQRQIPDLLHPARTQG